MNKPNVEENASSNISHEELMSALFAHMIIQQANMAMMLLGKVPNPATGETVRDVEGAKMFIDQLEMLEVKTKGNLSKDEEHLLKQSLMSLRMAFVETVESPESDSQKSRSEQPASKPADQSAQKSAAEKSTEPSSTAAVSGDESHKKFVKKY